MRLTSCAGLALTSMLIPSVALPCTQALGFGTVAPSPDGRVNPGNTSVFAELSGVELQHVRATLVERDVRYKMDVESFHGLARVRLNRRPRDGDRAPPGTGGAPPDQVPRNLSIVLSASDGPGPVEPISMPLNLVDLSDLRPPVFAAGYTMTSELRGFAPCGAPGYHVTVELDPLRDDNRVAGVALYETTVRPARLVSTRLVAEPQSGVRLVTNAGTVARRVCYEAHAFDIAGNETVKDLGCMNLGEPTIDAGVMIDAGGPTSMDAGTIPDAGTGGNGGRAKLLPTAEPTCTCATKLRSDAGLTSAFAMVLLLGLGLRRRKLS